MVNSKQFTIFFLLVVVFLVAIMIVTSLAWREQNGRYDTTSIRASLLAIVDFSASKVVEQETAMESWVTDVDRELNDVKTQIDFFQSRVDTTIAAPPTPHPAFW